MHQHYQIPNTTPNKNPQQIKTSSNQSHTSSHNISSHRKQTPTHKKLQLFLCTFLAYTSVHALRTTYSFSKSFIPQQIQISQKLIGIVDSIMILCIGIGNFVLTMIELKKPIRILWLALFCCSIQYCFIPITMSIMKGTPALITLCVLMGISGFLSSFSWPNLLPIVHSIFSPDTDTAILGFWSTCPNFGNIIGFVIMQCIVLNNGWNWQIGMYIVAMYMMTNAIYIAIRVQQMGNQKNQILAVQQKNNKLHQGIDIVNNRMSNQILVKDKKLKQTYSITNNNTHQNNNNIIINQNNNTNNNNNRLSKSQQIIPSHPQQTPIPIIQQQPSILKVFSKSPRITLLTISFALLKSVMYGILLWLPAYFYTIGLVQYSLYIPMTFDAAAIVGSTILGLILKQLSPNKKNIALIPVLFLLMIFFILLKSVSFGVAGYFIIIGCVGLCLGGAYNTMAGLVTMELVRTIPEYLQSKYLRFYSALLMCIGNVVIAITQIIISFSIGQNQGKLFGIFFVYTTINLCCLSALVFIQFYSLKWVEEIFNKFKKQGNDQGIYEKLNKSEQQIEGNNNIKDQNVKYKQIQIHQIK